MLFSIKKVLRIIFLFATMMDTFKRCYRPLKTNDSFRFIFIVLGMFSLTVSCKNEPVKGKEKHTIVWTTELLNDSNVFRIYDSLHSRKGIWPAIRKANMASGIEEIRIYRYGNRLMMMVDLPEGSDMGQVNRNYLNADKKVKEWGKLMDGFQRALPGVDSTKKWVEMKLIHHYRDGDFLE